MRAILAVFYYADISAPVGSCIKKSELRVSQQQILRIFKLSFLLGMLGLVGYIDQATGFEISVFPLYALPIGFAAWYFSGWTGVATAIGSCFVWYWADVLSGHVYTEPWVIYVNGGSRLVFFLFVALTVSYMEGTLRRARAKLQAFSGMLPVCTDCRKIGDHQGYWWEFSAYLRENGGAVIQPKLCPDCARKNYAVDKTSSPVHQ